MTLERYASSDSILLFITPRVFTGLCVIAFLADLISAGHAAPFAFMPDMVRFGMGWLIAAMGCGTLIWGRRSYKPSEVPTDASALQGSLVRKGPYRFSRNPIYFGYVSVLGGLALMMNGVALSVAAVVVFLDLNFRVIPKEEILLRVTFGRDYIDFCHRVRRWL